MKRLLVIITVMSVMFISCDRWPSGDFRWVNKTSHTIKITTYANMQHNTFTLAPEEEKTINTLTGPMSPQTAEEHLDGMRYEIIGDTIRLEYDDGKTIMYTYPADDTLEFSIYNLYASNLYYVISDKGWKSKFTYTFTNNQYETAE